MLIDLLRIVLLSVSAPMLDSAVLLWREFGLSTYTAPNSSPGCFFHLQINLHKNTTICSYIYSKEI